MRPLAILGCTSDAGKSLLTTACCRWFARRGIRVAPFKAQNMSNNARVVGPAPGDVPGGEIGLAQWLQARAAGVEPDVRMNPVLLKLEADQRSQVVVRGSVDAELGALSWDERHGRLWTPMSQSFDELDAEYDLIVIEGAGSPAEINLRDQVNNRMVEHADAATILVSDIDRGGSFAHLYGTWSLVPNSTRERLAGFVLNRFRGDERLLVPAPEQLRDLTGMAPMGVVPMLQHDLPAEEGAAERPSSFVGDHTAPKVVIPRLPYGSNLDEFRLLPHVADVEWAVDPSSIARLDPERDLIVLPGSKHVVADHAWLVTCGFDLAIRWAVERGVRVIGVCGGAMMLGRRLADPEGIEGGRPTETPVEMLGLLDLETVLRDEKRVERVAMAFDDDWWSATGVGWRVGAAPVGVEGYEIRMGELTGDATPVGRVGDRPVAWADRRVAATTVHGLFEDPAFVEAVVGPSPVGRDLSRVLGQTFDALADAIDRHLDTDALLRLVEG